MSFSRDSLLAAVPEHNVGNPSATSFEQVSSAPKNKPEAFNEVPNGVRKQRLHVAHAKGRLGITLVVHLVGFVSQIAMLVFFCKLKADHFLFTFVVVILINASISTWVSWRDAEVTFLASWGFARLPILFLLYGLLQYIHIKHIIGVYRRRRDGGVDGPVQNEFHPKTFDGIMEGIPLAMLCLWSYSLTDGSSIKCSWYLETVLTRTWPLLAAGWMSIITLAMGIIEVDYRVSEAARDNIDGSLKGTFFQWSYRFTEAGHRICCVVLLCVGFEPVAANMTKTYSPLFVMPLYPLFWVVVYYIILASSRAKNAKTEHFLAHFAVACCMWFINPVRFVDSPAYAKVARRINRHIALARLAENVIILTLFSIMFASKVQFPESCKSSRTIVDHIFYHDRQLPVSWILMLMLHTIVCILGPANFRITTLFSGEDILTDDTVLEMIPAGETSAAVAVRQTKARGISSHLLKIGTGVASQLFAKEEQAFGDFIIEKVLGKGNYGVVVLVRMRGNRSASQSNSYGPQQDVVYAMKMQNTEASPQRGMNTAVLPGAGAFRGTTAERESNILLKLHHPFIIRLVYFFEVPDRALKDASSGDTIRDNHGNRRFHKAIVMEYCPAGDLDGYVCKNAFPSSYKPGATLSDSDADWLQRCRRFCAEMCVALAFLHENQIIFRDLKPANVLLKSGIDGEMHICLTDFGFSKDVSSSAPADSLAGSPYFSAPEIQAIFARQMRVEYTSAVDLFSLGKTMCVVLYRTRICDTPPDLLLPSDGECKGDPRIHPSARAFIEQLTAAKPALRGSLTSESRARGSGDIQRHAFFQDVQLETGRILPAVQWASVEKYAC